MLNFGGFLSSNFWTNYRCQSSPSVEDLLNNKDCTVDKLLDDDDCLQEFKNYNDKLIKYFDHDKLKVLIDYITVMPTEENGHARGHKYPFLAGEIFNCEIGQILDKFFEAPERPKAIAPATPVDNVDEDDVQSKDSKESDDKKETTVETKNESPEEETKEATLEPEAEGTTVVSPKEEEKKDTSTDEEVPLVEPKKEENKEEAEVTPVEAAPETKVTDEKNPQIDDATTEPVKTAPTEQKNEETKKEEPVEQNTQEPQPTKETATTSEEEAKTTDTTPEAATTENKTEDSVLSTTMTTLQTEATDAAEEDDESENKFLLLERLFKFIKTEDGEQLNPVLSGYFCKLVSLLISRKQKYFVPYVFAEDSEVIDFLVKHVYQRSISEILNKLLTQIDSDYDEDLQKIISAKQQQAVSKLIETLGPDYSEEHNLNSRTILMDMFESKDYYNIICNQDNLAMIVKFSTAKINEATKASKMCSLIVLNQIINTNIEKQKKMDKASKEKTENHDEDDVVQPNSDDENAEEAASDSDPNSQAVQTKNLVDLLKGILQDIGQVLRSDHDLNKMGTSVSDESFVPLGQQRLLTVELVHKIVQMKKGILFIALGETEIFKNIMALVRQYQWNNFLQLAVIELCTEVFDNCDNDAFKKSFLQQSGIAKTMTEMSQDASYKMESERMIRNGYMGLVIKISNMLIKKGEQASTGEETTTKNEVASYLESVGDEWTGFVSNELKKSNDNNNKTLGGSTTTPKDDDDEDKDNYDVQMEKIMARFTNFNQILTQGNTNDNDSDDDDDNTNDENDSDDEEKGKKYKGSDANSRDDAGVKIQKVDLPEQEQLNEEFVDSNFWKVENETGNIDDLLAELDD